MAKTIAGIDAKEGKTEMLVKMWAARHNEGQDWDWLVLFHGEVSRTVVEKLLTTFEVDVCVIDAMPNKLDAKQLQSRFPDTVWLCHHVNETDLPDGVQTKWDKATGAVYTSRRDEHDVELHTWLAIDKVTPVFEDTER